MKHVTRPNDHSWGEVLLAYSWLRNQAALDKVARRLSPENTDLLEKFTRELKSVEAREARARCKTLLKRAGLGGLLEYLRL